MHGRWSVVLVAEVWLGFSLLACRPPPPTGDPLAVTAFPAAATATADDELDKTAPTTPSSAVDLAHALPSDAWFFIGFADLFAAADALGRDELVTHLVDGHRKFANQSREALGFDLSSPEELADFGLSPHGPGGFARLARSGGTEAFLFAVEDRRALRARLLEWAGENLSVERLGAVDVFCRAALGVVVDRDVAFFVPNRHSARELGQRLARIGARERLDRTSAFQTTFARLPRDADAVLFLDVVGSQDQESQAARLLEGCEGLGAAARVSSGLVEVDVELALRMDSPLREITATLRAPSPDVSALERFGERPPVMALELAFEPGSAFVATRSLFERLSVLDDEVAEIFGAASGLVPYLTGEFGVMCRPALATAPARNELDGSELFRPTQCNETYVLGLRDPAGAQRYLERLASPVGGRVLTRVGQDFAGKNVFGTFRFAVRERTLVITEDTAGLTKLGVRWPEVPTWTWTRTDQRAPIEYRLELDRLLREVDDDSYVYHAPFDLRPEGPGEPATARSKRRELERLVTERNRLERERAVEAARVRLEAARMVGAATVSFAPSPAGLRGHVTVRPGGASFGETWVTVANAIAAARAVREREIAAMPALESRISALVAEIEAILSRAP